MEQRHDKPAPRFRCDVCNQGFTRTDHLKRHRLRHSGLKPYVCGFCNTAFARCDSLRNHYQDCSERGDRPIPETDQKGRRRHACSKCISMKLKCDGNNPCGSCQKRRLVCEHADRPSNAPPESPSPKKTVETKSNGVKPSSTADRHNDMGSIKFLLNGGQDGFMEDLRFPTGAASSGGPTPILKEPTPQPTIPSFTHAPSASFPLDATFPQAADLHIINNSFFEGPFDAYHQQWNHQISGLPPPDNSLWVYNTSSPDSVDHMPYQEPQTPNVAALLNGLTITLAKLNPNVERQTEITTDLHFLLTPHRVRRFVSVYEKVWHPNCPIIHMATFNVETVTLPLLAAVVSMGAMYSKDQRDFSAIKRVLDLVEVFIFDSELFSSHAEILRAMASPDLADTSVPIDWLNFQNFQAAYLNVVVQHWAGNKLARDRSMEMRFSQVIRMARAMSLHKAHHHPEDRLNQDTWIHRECQIRTMNIIHSLDCAFLFFHNYPCRMSFAEMECELPCDELLFRSANPFTEPGFAFERSLTLRAGFESLFYTAATDLPSGPFRVLDMFLLIHVLYAFIITRLVLRAPFGPSLPPPDPGADRKRERPPASALEGADPVMARILSALGKWYDHWGLTCKTTTQDAWGITGFFKASYRYFQVAHLVASKHERVEGGWLLEPKCEEKLERLQILAA